MKCRICTSDRTQELKTIEFYQGYPWTIYDCQECGCRFTRYDPAVYNLLHTLPGSRYGDYQQIARECQLLFSQRDLNGIRNLLGKTSKYRFVIDAVECCKDANRVLEIGCSRGYLTSFFILAGYDAIGVDISEEAVQGAEKAFGNHFFQADSNAIKSRSPYDVIYHVGTIGCVEDPLGYTRRMLDMLRPGGVLLFNAPNLDACVLEGQLWLNGAPPPDLITLYRKGFWTQQFHDSALIEESVEYCDSATAFTLFTHKLFRRHWGQKQPSTIAGGKPTMSMAERLFSRMDRDLRRFAVLTGIARLAPLQPADFGLFVKMTKK